jgi:hypothetical protein
VPRIAVEQILSSLGRIDRRRAPCELPATAFHCREGVTGDSQVRPRNRCPSTTPSNVVVPQYSTTPPTPPDDPLTVVSPPPRCTAMDRSPGEPPSSPDPSNRAPTPPRCSPTGFPASPCRQRPKSMTTAADAPWELLPCFGRGLPARAGRASRPIWLAHVIWARPKPSTRVAHVHSTSS